MRALHDFILGIGVRRHPRNPIPARQHGPEAAPGEGKRIADVKGLPRSAGRQGRPLRHITVQHRAAHDDLLIPSGEVAREDERLVQVRLHGGVDGQRVEEVHGGVADGAEDEGGAEDGEVRGWVLGAVRCEEVFLCVVEVWLQGDAGVGFDVWGCGWAEVAAVVFEARLENYSVGGDGGEGEGCEEVLEEAACWGRGVSGADWLGLWGARGGVGQWGWVPFTSHISSALVQRDWPGLGVGWR